MEILHSVLVIYSVVSLSFSPSRLSLCFSFHLSQAVPRASLLLPHSCHIWGLSPCPASASSPELPHLGALILLSLSLLTAATSGALIVLCLSLLISRASAHPIFLERQTLCIPNHSPCCHPVPRAVLQLKPALLHNPAASNSKLLLTLCRFWAS